MLSRSMLYSGRSLSASEVVQGVWRKEDEQIKAGTHSVNAVGELIDAVTVERRAKAEAARVKEVRMIGVQEGGGERDGLRRARGCERVDE